MIGLITSSARTATAMAAAVAVLVAVAGLIVRGTASRTVGRTMLVTAALLGFFALWTGLLADGRAGVGVALFVAAIATFRLMNWFERPPRS